MRSTQRGTEVGQAVTELCTWNDTSSGGPASPSFTVANPGKRVSSLNFTHEASESQSAKTTSPSSVSPAAWYRLSCRKPLTTVWVHYFD